MIHVPDPSEQTRVLIKDAFRHTSMETEVAIVDSYVWLMLRNFHHRDCQTLNLMPRGSISDEKGIGKIGKEGGSICTHQGDFLGPRTPILEQKHVDLSSLFLSPLILL